MDIETATRPTRREKVEARERAILSAAREVFEAKGYDGARMADIARAIGAAEGTIYTYFPNKDALFRNVLGDFWKGLTEEARAAVARVHGVFPRFTALARRHLTLCLDNIDFIDLSVTVGAPRAQDVETRDLMRSYVAVFDEIFRAGVDRGELDEATPLWLARDHFYGALEYSARTLILRGDDDPAPVVDNLIHSMRASYAVASPPGAEFAARLAAVEQTLGQTRDSRVRPSRKARQA